MKSNFKGREGDKKRERERKCQPFKAKTGKRERERV